MSAAALGTCGFVRKKITDVSENDQFRKPTLNGMLSVVVNSSRASGAALSNCQAFSRIVIHHLFIIAFLLAFSLI